MKRRDVEKYFWEELDAYTLGRHNFTNGFRIISRI